MKHLKLIVLRELDHFRGWFFLLAGLSVFAVLLHVLVLTILPSVRLAEFLVVMKSYVVPGGFGILCGLMGYADSPEHGSHEFKTRPVRLKTLYFGKAILIGGTAATLVLVQGALNFSAGFPLGFGVLWLPLFLVGLSFFFLGALIRPTLRSLLQVLMMIGLPVALSDFLHVFLRDRWEVFPLGIFALGFVSALYFLGVFLAKKFLPRGIFWGLFLPLAAVAVSGGIWLLPWSQRVVRDEMIGEDLKERLSSELEVKHLRNRRFFLEAFEPQSDETSLHRLQFVNQVVEFVADDGISKRVRKYQRAGFGFDSSEERSMLMALGIIPPYTAEQLAMRDRYGRDIVFSSGRCDFEIPAELRGKDLAIRSEGFAGYWETESLGVLPIRVGAQIEAEGLKVELAEIDYGVALRLRVHARNRGAMRLGVFQKNLKEPFRPYGRIHWLTSHDVMSGMSTVDILEVNIHFEQIEKSTEAAELHLFTTTYRGAVSFRSKPVLFDSKKVVKKVRLLEANYPIRPSIYATESK